MLSKLWTNNIIKLLSAWEDTITALTDSIDNVGAINSITDIKFIINEKDLSHSNFDIEQSYFRLGIKDRYIWKFFFSNTDFFSEQTLKPKIQFYMFNYILLRNWYINYEGFSEFYKILDRTYNISYSHFKKQVNLVSKILVDLLGLKCKPTEVLKYDRKSLQYQLKCSIDIVYEELEKQREREKKMKQYH
jgi:hypothetical protein